VPAARQEPEGDSREAHRRNLAATALSIVLVKWIVVTLVTLAIATIMAGVFH